MSSVKQLISKHWRLIVFILGLIFVFWLIWALRNVLIPFIVGFILAYLLLPIIRWVEKHLVGASGKPRLKQLKRISIIVVVYLLSLVVIGGVIALLFAPQSGKETRKMIKDKATGMVDAIRGKAAEANEAVDAVKDKTTRAVHELKS